jgi:hypothetical protein
VKYTAVAVRSSGGLCSTWPVAILRNHFEPAVGTFAS